MAARFGAVGNFTFRVNPALTAECISPARGRSNYVRSLTSDARQVSDLPKDTQKFLRSSTLPFLSGDC